MDNEIKDMLVKILEGQEEIKLEVNGLSKKVDNLETEVRKTNAIIESEIKPNIKALFDGYKQNAEQLTRIEERVSKNEEFVLKRVK